MSQSSEANGVEGVDFIKLSSEVAAAKVTADNNAKFLESVQQRFEAHIEGQYEQFQRVYDKIDGTRNESTAQHSELAAKVDDLHNTLSHAPYAVNEALKPVIEQIQGHNTWINRIVICAFVVLASVVGYLLVSGPPWAHAVQTHEAHYQHQQE